MNATMNERLVGESRIWLGVLNQARIDLRGASLQNALDAAKFFFTDPHPEDAYHVGSFPWICSVLGMNPEQAAKNIFTGLDVRTRKRVIQLLRYNSLNAVQSVLRPGRRPKTIGTTIH